MRMLDAWSGAEKKEGTEAVGSGIDRYNDMHDGNVEGRNEGYAELVNTYYNLATDFYEWGWGQVDWLCPAARSMCHPNTGPLSHVSRSPCCSGAQSFHFADKLPAESFQASIARHEYYLALKLGLKVPPLQRSTWLGIGVS